MIILKRHKTSFDTFLLTFSPNDSKKISHKLFIKIEMFIIMIQLSIKAGA